MHNIPDYVQSMVPAIAFLVFMFRYDRRLSVICLVPIIIGFGLLFSMLKGESSNFIEKVQRSGEGIGNAATKYVRRTAVVKTFGQTASSVRRYPKAVKDYAVFLFTAQKPYKPVYNSYVFLLEILYTLIKNHTKHHLKFGKNQADNLEYMRFRRRFFPLFYWCLVLVLQTVRFMLSAFFYIFLLTNAINNGIINNTAID